MQEVEGDEEEQERVIRRCGCEMDSWKAEGKGGMG